MKASDFSFELPKSLIAQFPLEERSDSRLLVYDKASGSGKNAISHHQFGELSRFLRPGDLLVLNNTKVVPARFFGTKDTGGQCEFLLERIIDKTHCLCHIKASKAPKPGARLLLEQGHELLMLERKGRLFLCELTSSDDVLAVIESIGHMPLPPYIERADTLDDNERYQTVYAKEKGAVAAPTAGLHFDKTLFEKLTDAGVRLAELTLHVGAGTFQPVQVENVSDHQMHQEWIEVPTAVVDAINATKQQGGRVIAVGTTVVRSLETAAHSGELLPYSGDTDIFIYPGFTFNVIDGMVTNFHLPESTLIMLVAAFIGHQQTLTVYQTAVEQAYRFFSYGDACLFI